MSAILDFYEGKGRDGDGRTFDEILMLSNLGIEVEHGFIQFLFPLPEPSKAVLGSPILTPEDIAVFKAKNEHGGMARHDLSDQVVLATRLMAGFYATTGNWKYPRNHNHLRITRIIRFLTLIGWHGHAENFYQVIMALYPQVGKATEDSPTGKSLVVTRTFWQEALNEKPAWLET